MVKFPWVEKSLRIFGAPMFDAMLDPAHVGMTGAAAIEVRIIN